MSWSRNKNTKGKIQRNCKYCNSIFYVWPCHIKKGIGIYCCISCCKKDNRKPITILQKICLLCQNTFFVSKSYQAKKFCNKKCANEYRSQIYRNSKHPNWKGGISTRTHSDRECAKKVKIRDEFKCVRCGNTENLHAHHKEKYSLSEELRTNLDNGETLCRNCHSKEHPDKKNLVLQGKEKSGFFKNCLICQIFFYVPPYKKDLAKYCSRTCCIKGVSEKKKTGIYKICEVCSTSYYVIFSQKERSKFCSKACLCFANRKIIQNRKNGDDAKWQPNL